MAYRALKRMKVGHDEETDQPIYREVGDLAPEVESWKWQTVDTYRRNGYIELVPEADVASDPASDSGKSQKRGTNGK